MFNFTYKQIDFSHEQGYFGDTLKDTSSYSHEINELIYFVDGDVTYTIGNRSFKMKKGDIIFIPPKLRHVVEIYNTMPYEIYSLKFFDNVLPPFILERLFAVRTFIGNYKQLFSMVSGLDLYYNNFSDEELYTIYVCELIKTLIFLLKKPNQQYQQQYNELISSIISYIDENINLSLTAESISDYFGFSKSYISNEFKKHTNMPIMKYVREKKILLAHNMLLAGKKKLEVAESLGFKDYSTFYRAYTKIMGFKPE